MNMTLIAISDLIVWLNVREQEEVGSEEAQDFGVEAQVGVEEAALGSPAGSVVSFHPHLLNQSICAPHQFIKH